MFGVTCTCSWLELFVVIWSWVKNDAAPFLGVGGLVGGYDIRIDFIYNFIYRITVIVIHIKIHTSIMKAVIIKLVYIISDAF